MQDLLNCNGLTLAQVDSVSIITRKLLLSSKLSSYWLFWRLANRCLISNHWHRRYTALVLEYQIHVEVSSWWCDIQLNATPTLVKGHILTKIDSICQGHRVIIEIPLAPLQYPQECTALPCCQASPFFLLYSTHALHPQTQRCETDGLCLIHSKGVMPCVGAGWTFSNQKQVSSKWVFNGKVRVCPCTHCTVISGAESCIR